MLDRRSAAASGNASRMDRIRECDELTTSTATASSATRCRSAAPEAIDEDEQQLPVRADDLVLHGCPRQLRRHLHLEHRQHRHLRATFVSPLPPRRVLDGSAACDTTGPRAVVNLTWSGSPTAIELSDLPQQLVRFAYDDRHAPTPTRRSIPASSYSYKVIAIEQRRLDRLEYEERSASRSRSVRPDRSPPPRPRSAPPVRRSRRPCMWSGPRPHSRRRTSSSATERRSAARCRHRPRRSTISAASRPIRPINYTVTASNASGNATSPPASGDGHRTARARRRLPAPSPPPSTSSATSARPTRT